MKILMKTLLVSYLFGVSAAKDFSKNVADVINENNYRFSALTSVLNVTQVDYSQTNLSNYYFEIIETLECAHREYESVIQEMKSISQFNINVQNGYNNFTNLSVDRSDLEKELTQRLSFLVQMKNRTLADGSRAKKTFELIWHQINRLPSKVVQMQETINSLVAEKRRKYVANSATDKIEILDTIFDITQDYAKWSEEASEKLHEAAQELGIFIVNMIGTAMAIDQQLEIFKKSAGEDKNLIFSMIDKAIDHITELSASGLRKNF